jgi:hypothetical protein
MQRSYWECPRCGALNKAFAAVCFTCGGDTRREAEARARRADPERVMTRGARLVFAAALGLSALVGFALVRTFRSPALERAAAEQLAADTGREPVPPAATLVGAPDSGWPARAEAASPEPTPPADPVRTMVATAPAAAPPSRPRTYSDADLRAFVARRGVAAAASDRGYVMALRQRRVDDLRERLEDARSPDEREKLREWLDDAQADLERAR